MSNTASRARRLAEAASGEKVIRCYRIPDGLPRAMLVALTIGMGALCVFAGRLTLSFVAEGVNERQEQRAALAAITELCLQPVTLEDYADCFGDDCRLVYFLAVRDTEWRDALMQQEALQRSCNSIRHWAIKQDSSPAIITAQAKVP